RRGARRAPAALGRAASRVERQRALWARPYAARDGRLARMAHVAFRAAAARRAGLAIRAARGRARRPLDPLRSAAAQRAARLLAAAALRRERRARRGTCRRGAARARGVPDVLRVAALGIPERAAASDDDRGGVALARVERRAGADRG